MKNLFDAATVDDVKRRVAQLRPDTPRVWGTMNAAQMLAHVSHAMEMAVGDRNPPRLFISRLLGPILKRRELGTEAPMSRNSPTAKDLVIRDDCDLETERARLTGLIDRFASGGPQRCTTHPHLFFGPMTPAEWAMLTYKHADHHLRQFGM